MRSIAITLSVIFMTFIAGPTAISLIDDSVDISIAFTANEEESSSKNLLSFESLLQDTYSNQASIDYLRTHPKKGYSYDNDYRQVYLEVVSPPPKNI